MRAHKKWLIGVAASCTVVLLIVAGLVIWVDPFFQYHKPIKGFPYIIDHQLSQNPGMAKNFDYDSVILGSSMTVNFNTDWFGEIMGLNPIKLSYNGAYPRDQANIMKIVFDHNENVKQVFLGIDIPAYSGETEEIKFPIPKYLYDDNYVNDVSYWFNKDVILNYILRPLAQPEDKTYLPTAYATWWTEEYFDVEQVLYTYEEPGKVEEETPKDAFIPALKENLETNIFPFIESHPETKFTVFFPPFSILYWNNTKIENKVEVTLAEYEYTAKRFMEYENVEVYMFLDQDWIVCDLDNYADYTHYHKDINRYMTQSFQNGDCRLTNENIAPRIAHLRELSDMFTMDKLYRGELLPKEAAN